MIFSSRFADGRLPLVVALDVFQEYATDLPKTRKEDLQKRVTFVNNRHQCAGDYKSGIDAVGLSPFTLGSPRTQLVYKYYAFRVSGSLLVMSARAGISND